MKNYEAFIRMLNGANITFKSTPSNGGHMVDIRASQGPANEGQLGLYSRFIFNEDGELESVGTWESSLKLVA